MDGYIFRCSDGFDIIQIHWFLYVLVIFPSEIFVFSSQQSSMTREVDKQRGEKPSVIGSPTFFPETVPGGFVELQRLRHVTAEQWHQQVIRPSIWNLVIHFSFKSYDGGTQKWRWNRSQNSTRLILISVNFLLAFFWPSSCSTVLELYFNWWKCTLVRLWRNDFTSKEIKTTIISFRRSSGRCIDSFTSSWGAEGNAKRGSSKNCLLLVAKTPLRPWFYCIAPLLKTQIWQARYTPGMVLECVGQLLMRRLP